MKATKKPHPLAGKSLSPAHKAKIRAGIAASKHRAKIKAGLARVAPHYVVIKHKRPPARHPRANAPRPKSLQARTRQNLLESGG